MKKIIYKLALKLIRYIIINKATTLTSDILDSWGWEQHYSSKYDRTVYRQKDIKERDQVLIELDGHYYRVWHGPDWTFIGLESSVEWLQAHMMLLDKHWYEIK